MKSDQFNDNLFMVLLLVMLGSTFVIVNKPPVLLWMVCMVLLLVSVPLLFVLTIKFIRETG